MTITGFRPETAEELDARVRSLETVKNFNERCEREQLRILMEKYPDAVPPRGECCKKT